MSLSHKGSLMQAVDKMRSKTSSLTAWDDLWKDGLTPWDLGRPTPLLINELERTNNIPKTPPLQFRSLIPGCGGGYDLLTLQKYHDAILQKSPGSIESVVVGLDLSPTALSRATDTITAGISNDSSARIELFCGNFFDSTSNWSQVYNSSNHNNTNNNSASNQPQNVFDFIFDYTFFCALPPTFRQQWGAQMAQLLDPTSGRLLTFAYPILPDADVTLGPPYPVTIEDYVSALEPHGIVMECEPVESPFSVPSRAGKELVCYWTVDHPVKSGMNT